MADGNENIFLFETYEFVMFHAGSDYCYFGLTHVWIIEVAPALHSLIKFCKLGHERQFIVCGLIWMLGNCTLTFYCYNDVYGSTGTFGF